MAAEIAMAKISASTSALRLTKWHEYLSRFVFGGAVAVLASLIDSHWGPVIGGLFLAFPGIFPAGASLVEKHAEERKQQAGMHGAERGRQEASLEAAGASMGAAGLAAFGAVVWWGVTRHSLWMVLLLAGLAWATVSWTLWCVRERL
jgi:hypothetical protein